VNNKLLFVHQLVQNRQQFTHIQPYKYPRYTMHFSYSIFLALAASAFAAPTPPEKAGVVAPRQVDQLLSGLMGEVAVRSDILFLIT
jgi:hypothetical protein